MPAPSQSVDISNRALQILGAQRIVSMTESTKNARECSTCYDSLRQSLLRMKPWNFATYFAQLASVVAPVNVAPPNSVWANSFTYGLPSDFLRLLAVSPFATGWLIEGQQFFVSADYFIQNGNIITWATPPLAIRYVNDFQNVAQMDPIFREALAYYMAMEMCETLTQSNTKKQAIAAGFKEALDQSALVNAFDKPAQDSPDDEWITTRM